MKKTARIDALRNIQKRFVSWLSMVTIVFIGTSLILGLYFARSALEAAGFKYIEAHNFKDIDLACSIGATEKDLEKILEIPEIKDAEGMLSLTGQLSSKDKSAGAYLFSVTERISVPYAIEGRIPTEVDECGLCPALAKKLGVSVGDAITIQVTASRLADTLSYEQFTVVGILGHPDYMSPDKVDYCLIPKKCFDTSASAFDYTNILIDVDVPSGVKEGSKNYSRIVNDVRKEIKSRSEEMTKSRMKTFSDELDAEYEKAETEANKQLKEAKDKIDAGQKEFDDKIAEAQGKLDEAEAEIDAGKEKAKKELADGAKKIKDGENEYNTKIADGEKQLADAEAKMEKELNDAKWKIFSGFLEIDENEKLLNEKEEEYKKAKEKLHEGKEELEEGTNKFNEATSQVDEKLNDDRIQNRIIQFMEEIRDALSPGEAREALSNACNDLNEALGKDTVTRCQFVLEAYDDAFGFLTDQQKQKLDELINVDNYRSKVQELVDARDKLEQGQRDYDHGKEKLEDARKQLDQGWYSLGKAKEELAAGEAELARREPEARKQLADAKADFERQKEDGKKQLEDAKKTYASKKAEAEKEIAKYEKELEDAQKEFDEEKEKGEKQLSDARQQYADAEKEAKEKLKKARFDIDRAKNTKCEWLAQTRDANLYYMEFASYCDILNKLYMAFTPIYAIIVVIVCFFTMAIIVEEQSKQTGTCKALGMYKKEIRAKYLLFGATAAVFGALIGIGGGMAIERLVCNALETMFVFGNPAHKNEILPLILMPLCAAFVTSIAVYWSSEKVLRCSAVGLVSGNEPVKRSRKKAARGGKGSVYTRLVLNNFVMDMGRETVSVVVIFVCCMLIGLGTTIKLAHSGAMNSQVNKILLYDICLTMSETITEEEEAKLLGAIDEYDYCKIGKVGGVIETEEGQVLTQIFVVEDEDAFSEYYAVLDRKGKRIPIPEEGVISTSEMEDKNNLYTDRSIMLITTDLNMAQVRVAGHYILHVGKMIIMSDESYKKAFGREPVYNTFLIKTGTDNVKEIKDSLISYHGVSEISKADDLLTEKAGMIKLYTAVVFIVIAFSIMLSFMILLNLSNILVSHRMKELLTMRVNGFSNNQVVGYLVREILVTTSLGLFLGLVIGIPVTSILMSHIEANAFMFLRRVYVSAWALSLLCNITFAFIINAVAFRKINKVPLTDITKY
jgi:putative ABC transport system permease protein